MRIRMLVQLSGPSMALEPGDEHEFPQDEAVRLVTAGYAVPVSEPKVERAVLSLPPEKRIADVLAAPERPRGRRR